MGIIFNFLYDKNSDSNPKILKIDKEIGGLVEIRQSQWPGPIL